MILCVFFDLLEQYKISLSIKVKIKEFKLCVRFYNFILNLTILVLYFTRSYENISPPSLCVV